MSCVHGSHQTEGGGGGGHQARQTLCGGGNREQGSVSPCNKSTSFVFRRPLLAIIFLYHFHIKRLILILIFFLTMIVTVTYVT